MLEWSRGAATLLGRPMQHLFTASTLGRQKWDDNDRLKRVYYRMHDAALGELLLKAPSRTYAHAYSTGVRQTSLVSLPTHHSQVHPPF